MRLSVHSRFPVAVSARTATAPAALLAMGLAVAGCAGDESLGEPAGDDVVATSSAITTTSYQDATGKVRIRVKTCDPTGSAFTNCAYCTADDGWARIGGGAQILGENTPGAMLQASFPSPNFFTTTNSFGCTGAAGHSPPRTGIDDYATWVVRSSGTSHQLQAYVIEMQLVGDNGIAFRPNVTEGVDRVTDEVNPPATYTVETAEADLQAGYFLIGGGAYIFTSNPSNSVIAPTDAYLVESRPVNGPNGRAWRATARAQHNVVFNEPMKSYAIGIESCPAQWGGHCLTYPAIKEAIAGATTGYGTAAYSVPSSWVETSVGGYAPTTNAGARYLADLIPFNGGSQGITVRSKSNGTGGSGQTFGSTLIVGTTAGLYAYNTVSVGGVGIMTRPSGTNPQLQLSLFGTADQPATRWHFESLGSGTYRLRNGNPGSGSECAYRSGTSSIVRVTTCGTGNEFKWTFIGDPTLSQAQVRNVANGQCLDWSAGGGSGGMTNLVLQPCGGSGAPQFFYVLGINWP